MHKFIVNDGSRLAMKY